LSHLCINAIILARQARDKHRENSKKDTAFRTRPDPETATDDNCRAAAAAAAAASVPSKLSTHDATTPNAAGETSTEIAQQNTSSAIDDELPCETSTNV
jgi:hypothetical protein